MIFNQSLKFTLSALLLAAGTSAFAAEGQAEEQPVVQLSDKSKTTKTWSEFVAALNDHSLIKGLISDLPNTNSAKQAYISAKDNYDELYQDLQTKQGLKDEADAAIAEDGPKQTALNDANATLTAAKSAQQNYFNDNVKTFKDAYDKAEAQLATWQGQITDYDNQIINLNVASYKEQADAAKTSMDYYQAELDKIKIEEVTSTKNVLPWLKTILSDAEAFESAYDKWIAAPVGAEYVNTGTIYYLLDEGSKATSLYLAFGVNPGNTYDSMNEEDFWQEFCNKRNNNRTGVDDLYVYLGENNKDVAGTSVNSPKKIDTYVAGATNIVTAAVGYIRALSENSSYYTTTKTTVISYPDTEESRTIQQNYSNAKANFETTNAAYRRVLAEQERINNLKAGVQAQINGYTKVPENSAEGTLSQQESLKKEWEDAAAGQAEYDKAVDDAEAAVAKAEDDLEQAKTAAKNADADVTAAQAALATANKTLTTTTNNAQAAADEYAVQYYNSVSLISDVEAKESVTVAYSGKIYGNGHIITNKMSSGSIFSVAFNGELSNAAVNGQFATSTKGAEFDYVAYWSNPGSATGSNNGKYYDGDSNPTTFSNLYQLGFAAREFYGVDSETKAIVGVNDNTRVYSLTTITPTDATGKTSYVTIGADNTLQSSNGIVTIPTNMFAKSATDDVAGRELVNVYYENADNEYVCDNVSIVDGNNLQFFCPVRLTANKLTYSRKFKQGYNSICVPFDMEVSYNENIKTVATYDREKANSFWFKTIGQGVVAANTPLLLFANAAFDFKATPLSGVTVEQTTKQILDAESSGDDGSICYGLLKQTSVQEFKEGVLGSYKIYGLSNGAFHPAALETGDGKDAATFPAFRSVIYSPDASSQNQAPRRIRVCNEFGEDITEELESSIKNVNSEAADFEVEGGNGEIIITAGTDMGNVAIYTVSGKQVAVANVTEGTTTVKVSNGMYIVRGHKVAVR